MDKVCPRLNNITLKWVIIYKQTLFISGIQIKVNDEKLCMLLLYNSFVISAHDLFRTSLFHICYRKM
jgi:hypothetical protein